MKILKKIGHEIVQYFSIHVQNLNTVSDFQPLCLSRLVRLDLMTDFLIEEGYTVYNIYLNSRVDATNNAPN